MNSLVQIIDTILSKAKEKYFQPEKGEKPPKGAFVEIGKRGGHKYQKQATKNIKWLEKPKNNLTLSGIKIPPNWNKVLISSSLKSRLQAIGFDSKGRKQYLYSSEGQNQSKAKKNKRLKVFTKSYPKLLDKITNDLDKSEEAACLYLISKTSFRIGSTKDTKADKQAYGASTILRNQISINGNNISFNFMAKKGVKVRQTITDSFLAKKFLAKKSNETLFNTTDSKVRVYIKSISNNKFVIKDFRNYIATKMAFNIIKKYPFPETKTNFKKYIKEIATKVSAKLGNSPSMALKAYIAPEVFQNWLTTYPDVLKILKSNDETFEEFLDSIYYFPEVEMSGPEQDEDETEEVFQKEMPPTAIIANIAPQTDTNQGQDELGNKPSRLELKKKLNKLFVQKEKIYIQPEKGERPPKGLAIKVGPREGTYYESSPAEELVNKDTLNVYWHGSVSGDLRGGSTGLHLGTYEAARIALNARIGIPAKGEWDGTREYGKTKLAGKETLKRLDHKGYNISGFNVDAPEEDYYPKKGKLKYSDGTEVSLESKPNIEPFKIIGNMTNSKTSPLSDIKANATMSGNIKGGRQKSGFFYTNISEDEGSISVVVPNGSFIKKLTRVDTTQAVGNVSENIKELQVNLQDKGFDKIGISGYSILKEKVNEIVITGERANQTKVLHNPSLDTLVYDQKNKPEGAKEIENAVPLKEVPNKDPFFKEEYAFNLDKYPRLYLLMRWAGIKDDKISFIQQLKLNQEYTKTNYPVFWKYMRDRGLFQKEKVYIQPEKEEKPPEGITKESLKLKINKGINEFNEDTVISNEENDPEYGYGSPVNTT